MPSIAWLCNAIGCLSSRWAAGGGPGVLAEPEPSRSIPLRWEGAVQMVETPLGYTQSTCSPRTWIHVDPVAFNVEGGN